MSLSSRTIVSVSATLLALILAVYLIGAQLILHGFGEVEHKHFQRHAERGQEAIIGACDSLSAKLSDWANWDDSYEFVADHNEAYIQSNLNPASLVSLGVRAILYFDLDGKLVHATAIDPKTHESAPIPAGIDALIEAKHPVFNVHELGSSVSGLIHLPEGTLAIAGRPIETSAATGPARGTIAFVDLLSKQRLAEISKRLRANVTIAPLDGVLEPQQRAIVDSMLRDPAPIFSGVDPDLGIGSALVNDIDGKPAFLVQVWAERFVFLEAKRTTSLLLGTLAIAGLGAVVITTLVLRRTVLRRLTALYTAVHQIGTSGDLGQRVPAEGRDELADLGRTVNDLLHRAAASQAELSSKADALLRVGQELRGARDAAESANRAKSEFLANMSHEVRTPMTAILGYADLLAERTSQPGFQPEECIETIRRNAKHLLTIINDILDLSKIEVGRLQIERTECSPAQLAHEVVELLREPAMKKGLDLCLEFATALPVRVTTDSTRLRQILLNLVGNAIKFTHKGSITMRFSCVAEAHRLTIDVIDSGIGITSDQGKRLFRPFSQADASTSRVFGGTGLGLTISRRLAQLLDGSLDLVSTSQLGSTFRLVVDTGPLDGVEFSSTLEAPRSTSLSMPNASATDSKLAGMSILLAEDGPDNQRLIAFVLRKAGARVEIVGDGRAAIDAVLAASHTTQPFDLILMDMQMPILDGYGATRELRTRGLRTPVVALTAHAMEGDRNQCLAAGCDEYETKPIDRARLIAACARIVGVARRRAA